MSNGAKQATALIEHGLRWSRHDRSPETMKGLSNAGRISRRSVNPCRQTKLFHAALWRGRSNPARGQHPGGRPLAQNRRIICNLLVIEHVFSLNSPAWAPWTTSCLFFLPHCVPQFGVHSARAFWLQLEMRFSKNCRSIWFRASLSAISKWPIATSACPFCSSNSPNAAW